MSESRSIRSYPLRSGRAARPERDLNLGWDNVGMGEVASRNRKEPCVLLVASTEATVPGGSVYEGWGASHFVALWYVFDRLDQSPWRWSKADRKVAEEISSYWVTSARSGNPNGPGLPAWPAFANAGRKVLYLGDPIAISGVANIDSLSVFDAVYTAVRGKPFAAR